MSNNLDSKPEALYQAFSVLVVDDEQGMQAILKKALSKWFPKVDCAGSIDEAEILLLDLNFGLLCLFFINY